VKIKKVDLRKDNERRTDTNSGENRTQRKVILILDKIVIKEQRCAIIVKGDNYGEEIRNQRRRIE